MAIAEQNTGGLLAGFETLNATRHTQAQKGRELSSSLEKKAEVELSANSPDDAVMTLVSALIAEPGRASIIHKIGKCLEVMGEGEEATACYRGAIPDRLNSRYFNADEVSALVKGAADCDCVTVLKGHEKQSIELKPPVRNDTQKKYGQFSYSKTEADSTFCTVASQGAVWFDGFNTVAFDGSDNIIRDHLRGNEFACYSTIRNTQAFEIDGSVCFLDGRSSSIYYHWMLDILPKIGVIQKTGIELNDIDYFVVNAKSGFQKESLRLLGINEDRIIYSAGSQYFRATEMIIPYLSNYLGDRVYHGLGIGMGSWIPKYLQQEFAPAKPIASKKSRVYISRSTRGSRNISNESEIKSLLALRGFETVEFENLSIQEQAELMSGAEVVVGVHGAGFTNLSFCQAGTKVVEIFGDYIVPCYWALSTVAGLDYAQFMAESAIPENTHSDNPGAKVTVLRDSEIYVDAQCFSLYLDTLLG